MVGGTVPPTFILKNAFTGWESIRVFLHGRWSQMLLLTNTQHNDVENHKHESLRYGDHVALFIVLETI